MQRSWEITPWRTLKLKTLLHIRYSDCKTAFPDEERSINSRYVALHTRDRSVFDDLPEDILRWRISARTCTSTIPMVAMRTRLSRRWKNAFVDGLKHNGYELDGKKIIDGKKVPGLRGTLEVMLFNGKGFTKPYKDLVKDAKTTITELERLQSAPKKPQQDFRPDRKSWAERRIIVH